MSHKLEKRKILQLDKENCELRNGRRQKQKYDTARVSLQSKTSKLNVLK